MKIQLNANVIEDFEGDGPYLDVLVTVNGEREYVTGIKITEEQAQTDALDLLVLGLGRLVTEANVF